MNKADVKYRRLLNDNQVKVLHWLYWVRFSTSKQIAAHLRRSDHKTIQNKLQILEQQGLIGKRYDKSYKLQGRPAEYYLTPNGARQLEKHKPKATNTWAVKSLYKNKTVSDEFLTHCINVTETALTLKFLYGDKLSVYTKSYMVQYSNYPTWTPDLYFQLKISGQDQPQHYFLDIWDNTKPFFVSVRKNRNYLIFKDSGDWLEDTDYPANLAICEDPKAQKKLNRQIRRILDDTGEFDAIFATTTKQQLEEATMPADKIWLKVDADDEPAKSSLRSLFVTS